eukprot:gene20434-biopygen6726
MGVGPIPCFARDRHLRFQLDSGRERPLTICPSETSRTYQIGSHSHCLISYESYPHHVWVYGSYTRLGASSHSCQGPSKSTHGHS